MLLKNMFRKKKNPKHSRITLAISYRDCFGGQYVRELYTLYNRDYGGYEMEPQISTLVYNNSDCAMSYFNTLQYDVRNQHSDIRVNDLLGLYSTHIKRFNDMYPSDIAQKTR